MEISVNGRAAQPDSTETPGVSVALLRSGNKCVYVCTLHAEHTQTELPEHSTMCDTGCYFLALCEQKTIERPPWWSDCPMLRNNISWHYVQTGDINDIIHWAGQITTYFKSMY